MDDMHSNYTPIKPIVIDPTTGKPTPNELPREKARGNQPDRYRAAHPNNSRSQSRSSEYNDGFTQAWIDGDEYEPRKHEQPQRRQPQYEQPQYRQPQYRQPQYGQPQYRQPQYGQPQYGYPQYEQPPYGYPQYGYPMYDQPQYPYYQEDYRPHNSSEPSGPLPSAATVLVLGIIGFIFAIASSFCVSFGSLMITDELDYGVYDYMGLSRTFDDNAMIFYWLCIIPVLGIVFSAIAHSKSSTYFNNNGPKTGAIVTGRVFAKIGLIVSIIMTVLSVCLIIGIIALYIMQPEAASYGYNKYIYY